MYLLNIVLVRIYAQCAWIARIRIFGSENVFFFIISFQRHEQPFPFLVLCYCNSIYIYALFVCAFAAIYTISSIIFNISFYLCRTFAYLHTMDNGSGGLTVILHFANVGKIKWIFDIVECIDNIEIQFSLASIPLEEIWYLMIWKFIWNDRRAFLCKIFSSNLQIGIFRQFLIGIKLSEEFVLLITEGIWFFGTKQLRE